jgi:hypothetical protein
MAEKHGRSEVVDVGVGLCARRSSRSRGMRGMSAARHNVAAVLGLVWVAILIAPAIASADRGHVFGASFSGPCVAEPCEGRLKGPTGIAVSEVGATKGDVYVLDTGSDRVVRFSAGGAFLGEFNGSGLLAGEGREAGSGGGPDEELTGKFNEPEGIAIDNDQSSPSAGDVYVDDTSDHGIAGHKVIDKFTAAGKYVGQITALSADEPEKFFLKLDGVAVDSNGEVWIAEAHRDSKGEAQLGSDNFTDAEANQFIAFRPSPPVGFRVPGLAVDSEDDLYEFHTVPGTGPEEGDFRVEERSSDGALIEDPVDEEVSAGVATEPVSDDVYVDNVTSIARFSVAGVLLERVDKSGMRGSGVAVERASGTLYVVDSAADEVLVFPPEPPGPPTIAAGSASVSGVTSASAKLGVEINPRSEPGEPATEYAFQYGACASVSVCAGSPYVASAPEPEGDLVASYEPDVVGVELLGLAPDTVYHARLVAHNRFDVGTPVIGEEVTFTTQGVGSGVLPDGRAWELVSPPGKDGALFEPIGRIGLIQAAVGGDAVSYVALSPIEAEPQGYADSVQVLSSRAGAGSAWVSHDISLPHVDATEGAGFRSYAFFSEDLSLGVVQPEGAFDPSISDEASERTAYLRTDFSAGDPGGQCSGSCYVPLVSGCPPVGEGCAPLVEAHADVPAGTVFSTSGLYRRVDSGYPEFVGASADGSHVIVKSPAVLVAGAPAGKSLEEEVEGSLYEWSGGALRLVSVRPGGAPAPAGSEPSLGGKMNGVSGAAEDGRGAVSVDGSRVVWSEAAGKDQLYLRDVESEETVQIGAAGAVFESASSDDSRVFFMQAGDLYVFEVTSGAGEPLAGRVTRLSEGAGVLGTVIGASGDGSDLYFVGNGVLGDGGEHGAKLGSCGEHHEEIASQTCNLYLVRFASGVGWEAPRFIAALSGADAPDWGKQEGTLSLLTARVSPDGEWLAFMSQRSLTGYDSRDLASGKPDEEVFLFDAGTGMVVCASCDPTGGRPVGAEAEKSPLVRGSFNVWEEAQWLAAVVPDWTAYEGNTADYQSRYLSDSGRLFFDSHDELVPQAVNGTWDVYEYEPPGVGSCTAASVAFSERSGGCVGLISSGTAATESTFLDASGDGSDVFFLTAAKLVPADVDTSLDVYDAHECTGSSPCYAAPAAPVPCTSEASCRPAVTPQPGIYGFPPSAVFSGPGDLTPAPAPAVAAKPLTRAQKLAKALKACKAKRKRKQRASCEAAARKRYGPPRKKAKKAAAKRGGGR